MSELKVEDLQEAAGEAKELGPTIAEKIADAERRGFKLYLAPDGSTVEVPFYSERVGYEGNGQGQMTPIVRPKRRWRDKLFGLLIDLAAAWGNAEIQRRVGKR